MRVVFWVMMAIGLLVQSSSPLAQGEAVLQVSPTSLSFSVPSPGQSPTPQTITITNGGTGTLKWLLRPSHPWIKASPLSGTAPSTATISIDTSGLSTGSHSASISIIANAQGSPKTVTITLTVGTSVTPGPGPGPGPGNQLPVAAFTYSPQNPKPGEVITFDCSTSRAPANRKITSCYWDFHGQGAFVAELEHLRQHKFNEEGYFTVTLTVKDDSGAENYISKIITISKTPVQDRDGDGVPDAQDRCPDQQGPSSNNGCPISPPETLESAVDSNKSGYIEDGEMIQVLNAWIKGGLFAGKFTVRERDILSLLTKWVRREKLPVITPPFMEQNCAVTILNPLPLPGYLTGGLLWDEGTLWNSGMAKSPIDVDYSLYRINATTGAVEPPAPLTIKGQSPTENLIRFGGITWNGKVLVGAEHTGVIHFLNRSGARVGIWPRLSMVYLAIDSIRDITWDGKAIWVLVKARPANAKELSVYLLKLNDSGGVIQFTPLSESGIDGMVWDGKSFWMTNVKKDQVYQVNTEGKIQRVCTIPKELRAPRGIAWDGTNFWVLSTSNMKIYNVSIK